MKRLLLAVLLASAGLHTFAAEYAFDYRNPQAWAGKPSLAVGDQVSLTLAEDLAFTLRIVSAPPAGIAGQSFIANVEGVGASAILKATKKGLRVTIDDFEHSKLYTATYRDGEVKVKVDDTSSSGPEECGTCGESLELPTTEATETSPVTAKRKLLGATGDAFPVASQKSVVDILVAFDQGAVAKSSELGYDTIEGFADYAVNKMNLVLVNSQLDDQFCYRLAGVTEIDGTWTAITQELLRDNLRARVGPFAKLSQLRDKYGADTITLLIDRTSGNTSGIGFEYGTNSNTKVQYTPSQFDGPNYPCNICDINTVYSRYTMSHETGHNMGCGHSNRQGSNSGPGRYSYSCGYHFTDANNVRRGTVMAYTYSGDDNYYYDPVPYFSTPDISPSDYGCALGVAGINDNRQTLQNTHADIASLREHVMPYDWDVKFFDDNGNEIPDGAYFYGSCYVTLTHENPEAEIYYTLDGSTPNPDTTTHVASGSKVYVYLTNGSKTLTACAVVDGKAQSVRSITLHDGITWSGDENGNGLWTNTDTSVTPWNGRYFYDDAVLFPDLTGVSSATITVNDAVSPSSVSFRACETAYQFDKGSNTAQINVPDASFAPGGNLTFNVPVKMDAVVFTNLTGNALTFNAPFGQTVETTNGYCTNPIVVGAYGQLTVAPGIGKKQRFDRFSTTTSYPSSTVRFGNGDVEFNSDGDGGEGVFGNAQVIVDNGCNLVLKGHDTSGYSKTSPLTINKGGSVVFNSYDTLRRPLILNGGTLRMNTANRIDWFNGNTVTVTDDSLIEGIDGSFIHVRKGKQSDDTQTTVNVAGGKTLTVDMVIGNNPNFFTGDRLVKDGNGEILVKKTITHGTAIAINAGTFTIDYVSPASYGTGWSVANGAALKIKKGAMLALPALTAESGAILSLPVSSDTPLTVNGTLDLDGVKLELTGGGKYSGGDRFTVLTATDGLSNFSESNIVSAPMLGDDREWVFEITENSVVAWIKDYAILKNELELVTNDSSLDIIFPKDAEVGEDGGIVIDDNPLVLDSLSTTAVAITLDVEIPEGSLTEEATICSWKVGSNIARCVRRSDGKLDCYHGTGTEHVANAANFMEITPGRHIIKIGYYSYDNNINGGTFVHLDNQLAYRGAGLRWSNDSVNRITVGGTAYDPSTRVYSGLVVHGFAVINTLSKEPIPNVTSSGGSVEYEYMTQGYPCVFALPPAGGFMLNSSILRATIGAGRYDSATVSMVAAFPADKTGTIVSLMVSDYDSITFQAEYLGDGEFMLRSNDNDYTTYPETCNIDVSKPHLYTIAYNGSEVTFYVDGNLLIESYNCWGEVVNEIDFGCGYWNEWTGSENNNPNPLAGLKVYASDIKLGTDTIAASENAVMASLNFDSQFFAGMAIAEKLAYLEEQQTASGVVSPVGKRLPVVDILVAYDNGGASYVKGIGKSLEEFAEEQITKMNTVLAINKLDAEYSYRLAGICAVDAKYTDINAAVSLIQEGAGPCTTLRAAREMCGADTVTLLINTTGIVLGHSSQPNYQGDMTAYHDECFSVCSISAVDTGDQHTMLHENAHTLGCGHAREQYTAQDIAEHPGKYSYGYYFKDGNVDRHTIMAYSSANNKYYQPSPYFSTSSDEFGLALGDANNDNARVIRATCGYVSNWRESIKPFDDDVIISDDSTGKELLSGHIFAGNINIALTSAGGRPIYYTLDGANPTKDSAIYSGPIAIADNATLTFASLASKTLSPPRTVRLFRVDSLGASIAAGVSWRTNVKYPWIDLGDGVIRSCNHTDYSYYCTTPLVATITGPKRLNFKERSYFRGSTPSQGSKYSHYEVLVDDVAQVTEEDCENSWQANYVDIPSGEHEVSFVYSQRSAMNNPLDNKDGAAECDDAVWLTDIMLDDVECQHHSSSTEVSWTFPADAKLTDDYAHGVLINSTGIANNLDFGSTNAVCASVLASLPDNGKGDIIGLLDINGSSVHTVHAYLEDGSITIYYDGTAGTAQKVACSLNNCNIDPSAIHIWTLAYDANTGARFYCDGELIANDLGIKWTNPLHKPSSRIVFGANGNGTANSLTGMKIYAIYTDFWANNKIFDKATSSDVANELFGQFAAMEAFAEDSLVDRLYTFTNYRDTGTATPRLAESAVLRISEIMPKPTDAQNHGALEGMDVNGLESGWVEVENTSPDKWANLADYKFIRSNRGKKTGQADYGNFPSVLIAPHGRAIFYTSERYSNSADMSVSAWATPDEGGVKPKIYTDLGNILVWPDKVNPKKSPFVRLTYTPSNTIVDTVIIPSDVPEGYSIIVGETKPGEATKRWLCPTPTRGTANTDAGLVKIGPNVGPLYELTTGKKHDSASEFARPVPTAQPGEDYEIVFSLNPVMSPTVAGGFRDEDAIASITLVYRTDLDDTTLDSVPVSLSTDVNDTKDWGHTYKAYIPADDLPAAGHLVQWKFEITDASGNNWTSPSFNNPDDGYEWYGTIVEPDSSQMSATLPTWHMFADSESLEQMDVDASDQTLANNARVAIYDSSTSNYYDYVRIDLRGNTSAKFTKKSHGLRFAKAHPLTMTDVVTGEQIEEIRKTSLISEFADPSYMRQMMAFWLWRKMGNLVPFDFPVRCNLNGKFYQLAFNSERFTDELIEDVYGLDKFGYGYKNVGTLKSGSGTTAGGIEKKTPDDEDESNITVLQNELRAKITEAQDVSSSPDGGDKGLNNADLTKFVVQKFNLPAWLNYLASARITQEMDDVWANVCAYYDNAEMKKGVRGTGTWMPLGYDFNLSFGQYYYNDIKDYGNNRSGLMSNQDWYKSHPFYGGNRVRCWKQAGMSTTCNYGNDGFEAVWQSSKFRRLYLRRLRTLMDQELKEPGTAETDTPFMAKMREMADLMRDDAASDKTKWGNDSSDNAIDVWSTRPADMDAGIDDIWENYVVPRRQHLYVTHSATNTTKTIGYGSNLNAGIPNAQSPIADLKAGFSVENATDETMTAINDTEKVVIMNANAEAVDMSGWRLTGRFEMTLPAGAVVDANDTITVVADRRTYIEAHDLELTDQVIIGNAKLNSDSTTLLLNDADGTKVLQVAPPSDESLYLRLHSFDGIPPSPSDGDTDEWITLTNISETATLDLSGVRVVFLKTGDTVSKCDFTIQEGQIDPLGSVTVRQSDYAAAGWTKITNGELTITVYDANGLVAHSGGVVQKDHKNYRGAGGPGGNFFIRLKEFDVATFESGDFEEVAYPVTTVEVVPGEDTTLEAETQEDAEAALADCEIVLSAEDEDAGLVTNVLKLVAVQIVSVDPLTDLLTTNYVARVEIDETQVLLPAIDETPSEGESVEIKEENPGETTVSVAISNAVTGLWYGYIVADELGSEDNFAYDIGSFERATGLKHTIKGSPRDKTQKPSGFFRVKVLPAKPTE